MAQNDAVSAPSCWKMQYDESKSFFCNLKDRYQEFVDAPFKDHKDCFKLSWDKMIDKYSPKTTTVEEEIGNRSTDLQPTSRNC